MDRQGRVPKHEMEQVDEMSARRTGGTILSLLLDDLQDPNSRVRILAIREIAGLQDDVAVEPLLELAQNDPYQSVRCAALLGLGDFVRAAGACVYDPETNPDATRPGQRLPIKVRRVFGFLLSACRDESLPLEERCCAIEALSFIGNDTVEDAIAKLYARPEKWAKTSALRAMGRNGSRRWANVVRCALYDSDRDLQLGAIHAAGEIDLESLGKDLLQFTYSEDQEVMLAALWSLGETGWDGAFERLDELTMDRDPDIRQAADEAMEEWLFYSQHGSEYKEWNDDRLPASWVFT